METARDGMAFCCKQVVNTKPMRIWKREESPSAGIFTTKAERNPSVNNKISTSQMAQQHGLHSYIQQGRFKGKLFINKRNQSDGARLQEGRLQIRYTTAKLSTMRPLRPLRSTAKSFHQATPDPYSHIYKHTHTHKYGHTLVTHTLTFNVTQIKTIICPTHREHPKYKHF